MKNNDYSEDFSDLNAMVTALLCNFADTIYDSDDFWNVKEKLLKKVEEIDEKSRKLSLIRDRIKFSFYEKANNKPYLSWNFPN